MIIIFPHTFVVKTHIGSLQKTLMKIKISPAWSYQLPQLLWTYFALQNLTPCLFFKSYVAYAPDVEVSKLLPHHHCKDWVLGLVKLMVFKKAI